MTAVATSLGAIGVVEASGGGTPIVFLHGVGSDKSVWEPQLAHFSRSRRAVAFDYPGYGDSDPAPEGTTRDDYAAAILAGMDALGIEVAHVCGLSLGGVVAIAMHALAPGALDDVRREVVETMATIDPAAYRIGAEAVWLADQRGRAAAIDVPTLVIVGQADRITPPELSTELAALIPGAKLETIPGAGHISNLERPAEFDLHVEQFLAQVERG
jgi:3-oxoadipate enol-lactonase